MVTALGPTATHVLQWLTLESVLMLLSVLYFAPTAVAIFRKHPRVAVIVFLNLFPMTWLLTWIWILAEPSHRVKRVKESREAEPGNPTNVFQMPREARGR